MNLKIPLLAVGAVLLLIGAVVLPASAAGPYLGNQTGSQDGECDGNMYQHQHRILMQQTGSVQDSASTNIGISEQSKYQYQYRIASGSSDDQGHFALGDGTKQQGATRGGNGEGDRTRTHSRLHDGSCGNCPTL